MLRSTFIVGHIQPSKPLSVKLARRCAWGDDGGHWMSLADERLHQAGAPTTHGLCPFHEREFAAQLDAMPTPPNPPKAA